MVACEALKLWMELICHFDLQSEFWAAILMVVCHVCCNTHGLFTELGQYVLKNNLYVFGSKDRFFCTVA